ncbi:NAD-dependent epimerase/dehydratase family protein [Nonomuraea terrae]|uniref:NAD-dependent epimerase/dehydratase family protein n=1 Tax=Nonomuraea terrae TaxID=2530383 RepID=UPI00378832B9
MTADPADRTRDTPDDDARGHVVITGGCGFIGSHLTAHLARRGFRVTVFDRAGCPANRRLDPRAAHVQLDITDFEQCRDAVGAARPSVVFHLAASSTVDSGYLDPHGSLMANVTGTINLLEAVRVACPDLDRFVFTSTDKVYGELLEDAYTEMSVLGARGVYDVGKLSADGLVRMYGDELGLPVSVLRLCNVFGPGDDDAGPRIVPRSLSRLFDPAEPKPPLVYEGSLRHRRDYVYVGDVCRALAAIALSPRARGEVFNMAPAAHRTTVDLVEELIRRSSEECRPHDPERAELIRANGYEVVAGSGASQLRHQHCDATKLSTLLGFRNEVDLAEGLRRTIAAVMRERRIARPLEPTAATPSG